MARKSRALGGPNNFRYFNLTGGTLTIGRMWPGKVKIIWVAWFSLIPRPKKFKDAEIHAHADTLEELFENIRTELRLYKNPKATKVHRKLTGKIPGKYL